MSEEQYHFIISALVNINQKIDLILEAQMLEEMSDAKFEEEFDI